jgi:hypothetical protein
MQQAYCNVNIYRVTLNRNQSLVHVGRSSRKRRGTRISNTDHTLGLRSDFVDFHTSLADDCQNGTASATRIRAFNRSQMPRTLTRANEIVRNPELLNGSIWTDRRHAVVNGRTVLGATLIIHRVLNSSSILVLEQDSSDIINGDVDCVCHSHDR